ncbi:LacI family DNA-binding transcriptional regulator [Enterovibrio paralichthyis]|uniref:LacI family DNA-binding transcriptional regulator n=1 Tax=Enterovibrio paralichthyis TaxID=2853805 RepID=UPI002103D906|nr:LacI family DNA-binding transcriptional regulator [Enterovibrio paralichthyis]
MGEGNSPSFSPVFKLNCDVTNEFCYIDILLILLGFTMSNVRDIAKLAGVSIATVSRVVNTPEKVSPEARARVEAVMNEIGYQPHQRKRAKPTELFGVIVPDITNPFFSQFLDVLEKQAYLHGRSILFFNSRHDRHKERLYLEECARHKVDGVFLLPLNCAPAYLKQLQELPYPVVVLTRTSPLITSFGVDHAMGGMLAAKHLVDSGHTRIGFIGVTGSSENKFIGFRQHLAERGFPLKETDCFDVKKEPDLVAFLKQCFEQPKPPTAFFCMNDVTADKLLRELEKQGIYGIDVVGFDDSMTARLMVFSSIAQPINEMAYRGFEEMLVLVNEKGGKHGCYTSIRFPPRLVVR